MTKFQVDLGVLASVHDQVSVIHNNLSGTKNTTESYRGALGDGDLEGDFERFFGDWSNYWQKVEKNMENLVTALQNAIDGYAQTDDAIKQAATTPASDGPPGAMGGPK